MTKSPVLRACKHTQAPRAVGACCQRGLGRPAVIPLWTPTFGLVGFSAGPAATEAPRTLEPVVESTQLAQPFHRDPAGQLLVATTRIFQCPIMTKDSKIEA